MEQINNTIITLACGCKITEKGFDTGKTRTTYNDIDYCPKHKVAPQMYEALKLYSQLSNTKTLDGSCAVISLERLGEVSFAVVQALAKAEGKEV